MKKEEMVSKINAKFEELKASLEGDDLEKIKELMNHGDGVSGSLNL